MPINPTDKTLQFRPFISLLMLVVLLTLGFCPLRNALCKLVHPAPAKTRSKVPEYGKIIAGDDCGGAAELAVLHSTEHWFGGPGLLFFAVLLSPFFTADLRRLLFKVRPRVTIGGYNIPIAIYLKNLVLRI